MSLGGRRGSRGHGVGHGHEADQGGRWLDPAVTGSEKELRRALDEAAGRDADEVALRRVWSRLAQTPDLIAGGPGGQTSGRSWWKWAVSAWLVGAGTVAVGTIVMMAAHSHSRRAESGVLGSATSPSAPQAAGLGSDPDHAEQSVLMAPATVRTARGEVLNLSLRGGTAVTLTPESILTLDKDDRPAVAAGEIRFHVPHQPPGQQFVVAARHYRVVVVGTRFAVQVADTTSAPKVGVEVEEGVVEVWDAGGRRPLATLHAGEGWTAPSEGAPTTAEAHPAAAAAPGGSALRIAAAKLHPSMGLTGHPLEAALRARRLEPATGHHAPFAVALATPSTAGGNPGPRGGESADEPASLTSPGGGEFAPASPGSLASESADATEAPPVLAPSPRAAIAPVPPAPEVAALLNQAKAARAAGDRHKALGLYRRLTERGGPVGEDAAYEMGRLYRDELAQPREAIATWRLYRARNPRGLLRIEADLSIIETLMALDDKSGALSEASDFIRRYPEGERHPEMARLVGDLSRERGECQAAIDAYDEVLSDARARGSIVDEVSFHRATCLLRKDPGAGREAIRAYARKFPDGRFRAQAQRLIGGGSLEPGGSAP